MSSIFRPRCWVKTGKVRSKCVDANTYTELKKFIKFRLIAKLDTSITVYRHNKEDKLIIEKWHLENGKPRMYFDKNTDTYGLNITVL